MEKVSGVARDSRYRFARTVWMIVAGCMVVTGSTDVLFAQPQRPRSNTTRPNSIRPNTTRPGLSRSSDDRLSNSDGMNGGRTSGQSGSRDEFQERGQSPDSEESDSQEATPGEQTASVGAGDARPALPKHVHPQHPLVPALQMAYKSRETLREVKDYTAVFVKKELIANRYITHTMDMKYRERPSSVCLRFQEPSAGRQVLYTAGANGNKLLVQEPGIKGGLLGTIALNPTDQLAMSENRHPITEIGIAKMLGQIIREWENEAEFGEVDVKYYPEAKLGNYPVRVIQASHPVRRNQFKYHLTRLFLDGETLFPVRVERYDWPTQPNAKPVQVELYMYSSVRTNVGLTERDFDPRQYGMRN